MGSRNAADVRAPVWPGSIFQPCATCGLSLLVVLAWFRGFFSRAPNFLPPKPTSPNSDSTRTEDLHENQLRLMGHFIINIIISYNVLVPQYTKIIKPGISPEGCAVL